MISDAFIQSAQQELITLLQGLVALALGGAIGWERETAGKWAGLRTHMLVCFAAMLFVRLGTLLIATTEAGRPDDALRADPVRIIEAIVTGISFLGAGTVFRSSDATRAKGLTTAASLLATAPIGIAVAINRYVLAVGATLLVLFVLRTMLAVEIKLDTARKKPTDDD